MYFEAFFLSLKIDELFFSDVSIYESAYFRKKMINYQTLFFPFKSLHFSIFFLSLCDVASLCEITVIEQLFISVSKTPRNAYLLFSTTRFTVCVTKNNVQKRWKKVNISLVFFMKMSFK